MATSGTQLPTVLAEMFPAIELLTILDKLGL